MLKTNFIFSRAKIVIINQCFSSLICCLVLCACSNKSKIPINLTPCDTVILPRNIASVRSVYMPEYETQINTYSRFSKLPEFEFEFCFCIDSLYPTSVFPFNGTIRDYLVEDSNSFIFRRTWDSHFIRINSSGETLNELSGEFGKVGDDELSIFTFNFGFPLKKSGKERLFYSRLYNPAHHGIYFDEEKKRKTFSAPSVSEFLISENKILNTNKPIAYYPAIFSSKNIFYYRYIPNIVLNRKLDVIISYLHIDSLFVNSQNQERRHYPLNSKYKTKAIQKYDPKKMDDKIYEARYACENLSYTHLFYDVYRNQYYVIVAKPMVYENSDGTFNSPKDKPWALMIIDSTYNKIAEIDMPDYYSKHDIIIEPRGIAIQDKNLTVKYQQPVYIIFKMEEQ